MKTYRIGAKVNGDHGRFEVTEENGKVTEVYDAGSDSFPAIIPPESVYDTSCRFRTIFGETFQIVAGHCGDNSRYLNAIGVDRLVAVAYA